MFFSAAGYADASVSMCYSFCYNSLTNIYNYGQGCNEEFGVAVVAAVSRVPRVAVAVATCESREVVVVVVVEVR